LYYLAVHPEGISRDALMLFFWPDALEGRKHLRELLSKLRRQLGCPDLLMTSLENVYLDHARVYVDVLEFQSKFDEVQKAILYPTKNVPLPEPVFKVLKQAVYLWQSPFFLSGANLADSEPTEVWLRDFGHNLEHRRLELLDRMADHHTARGELNIAAHCLAVALEYHNLDTDLHFRLITCLDKLGRRVEVMNHIESVTELFEREDLEIPQKMKDLFRSIREQAPPPRDPTSSHWSLLSGEGIPFVGRVWLVESLQMAFAQGGIV
jgi:DNA-binding SARP family transcriptional activator